MRQALVVDHDAGLFLGCLLVFFLGRGVQPALAAGAAGIGMNLRIRVGGFDFKNVGSAGRELAGCVGLGVFGCVGRPGLFELRRGPED